MHSNKKIETKDTKNKAGGAINCPDCHFSRGKRSYHSFEQFWFICNREGNPRLCKDRQRALKRQGSNKIGGHCTAYMTAQKFLDSGQVCVRYCLGHTGHDIEFAHVRIQDEARKRIGGKLAKGISLDKILDEIREASEGGIN
eukprot:gene6462-7194_t